MSSETGKPKARSAAWRISLWGTLVFACGSLMVFLFLQVFVARDIQRRGDAWLTGEVGTLSDVAGRTPKDRLYKRVVGEVAELASREVPYKNRSGGASGGSNAAVFFLQTTADGTAVLWVGNGDGHNVLNAIHEQKAIPLDAPFHLQVRNSKIPFRVAAVSMADGGRMYLGLSERDQLRVLRNLRVRFLLLWMLNVLLGFGIVFYSTRRMLGDVREITEAASRVGESDLSQRVPISGRNDEVGQLAATLNRMLDRIELSIHQLHSITNTLAHDLRSPLTAIRAKLEMSLTDKLRGREMDPIVSAIDEVDRLTEMLTKSLDVAEAQVDALRLDRTVIDLDELLRVMIELYEPCMQEKGLRVQLRSAGPVRVFADAALFHRVAANLFDNEWKHLPGSCTVTISLSSAGRRALLVLEDDGPGFAAEISETLFRPRVKAEGSPGRGLGLAFVEAVVGAHGGKISAENRAEGGARLTIELALAGENAEKKVMEMVG